MRLKALELVTTILPTVLDASNMNVWLTDYWLGRLTIGDRGRATW
jgi:hypothetical protein